MGHSDQLSSLNLPFAEAIYTRYLQNPASVEADWRSFFEGFGDGVSPEQWLAPADALAATQRGRGPIEAVVPAAPDGNGNGQVPGTREAVAPVKLSDGDTSEAVAFLRGLSLFRRMPPEELHHVAELARVNRFEPGDVICWEGEIGNALYIITKGRVAIRREGRVLTELGVGEVVGELAVLDNQPRSADVLAEGPVEVLEIRGDDFQNLLDSRRGLARGLLQVLIRRVRETSHRQARVDQLIRAYRSRGHVLASLDPLGRLRGSHRELTLEHYGLNESDLDRFFAVQIGEEHAVRPLRETLDKLKDIYCGATGVQYMHIDDLEVQDWLRKRLENIGERRNLSRDEQLRTLSKLTDAETFEQFLHRKFVGAKRFSLEGAESLIPLMYYAIEQAGGQGVQEILIGMAHRGRLNVLANILNKPPSQIFREFQDVDPELHRGRGDVKYHMGHSSDLVTSSGQKVHISLSFNPSHLEFVAPVVLGRTRAKQDRRGDMDRDLGLSIIIHGDAAFAGQGVVQEVFNMSELPGYHTGGAVHIIVNNQIGFTTLPEDGRSSHYATDVARMLQIPIFHVNGEQPDAVARVIRMAMDFRFEFGKDVVIDMYCYRKYGHNEGDDPTFTQPMMYAAIQERPTVLEAYLENLLKLGEVTRQEGEQIAARSKERLEEELERAKNPQYEYKPVAAGAGLWRPYVGGPDSDVAEVHTGLPANRLTELMRQATKLPKTHEPNRKVGRFLKQRREMGEGGRALDWGGAEALAFASLLSQGVRIRMTGQDVKRGTFSHRHATIFDSKTGEEWTPLEHLSPDQAIFEIFNSPLTEVAVVGFEYGFSLDYPDALLLWEAQFGDFCNVAQVIIDQFISSSEDKWRRLSGMVMLLPHGFEGQGPEHSSARLERFLQLAAEDNVQVVNLTTPAQYFHCLRRQVLRPWRKPLIVMSPKSLLRHPEAVSSLDELATGQFQRVMPDTTAEVDVSTVRRVLLCSGKVYYDLAQARKDAQAWNVAIIRLEQYYPLPKAQLKAALSAYPEATPVVWVQEEPENMGAWSFVRLRVGHTIEGAGVHPLTCVSRPESASPATGSAAAHKMEQADLLETALAP